MTVTYSFPLQYECCKDSHAIGSQSNTWLLIGARALGSQWFHAVAANWLCAARAKRWECMWLPRRGEWSGQKCNGQKSNDRKDI